MTEQAKGSEERLCGECGAVLSPLAPMGLCPKCLVRGGMVESQDAWHDESFAAMENLGTEIDRYKLLEQVGEGGFGVVYMAEQRAPIKRMVALKIIKLGMDTKQVIARFESERQALALMEHPNIARVLDAGATCAGRPYFVMELVRGIPITRFSEEQELSLNDRLRLFLDVCSAVQHAHQKGIIHRDLKPSNVLVTMDDDRPMPKIIDFGIAKATAHRLTDATLFTQFRQFVGTPAYMSPEQVQMNNKDVDTRSDIYALGVLMYELLTGQTPIDPDKLLTEGQEALFRVIREDDPPKPSTRITELQRRTPHHEPQIPSSDIPLDLDSIVMKALEKDRTRRYDTANAFAADVRHYLAGDPVSAVPPSNLYRLQKFVKRHRFATLAGLAVTLSLVVGLGLSLWSYRREREARTVSDEERSAAEAARSSAESARLEEKTQRRLAEDAMANRRKVLYASDMQVAQNALALGDTDLARTKLKAHIPVEDESDLRGWEWRYLFGQLHQAAAQTHRYSRIDAIAVSPTNQLVVSGYRGNNAFPIEIFEAGDLTHSKPLRHIHQYARAFTFSENGTSFDIEQGGRVTRVDLATNEERGFRRDDAYPLKLTPDGKHLVGFYHVPDDPRTSMHVRTFATDTDALLAETSTPYLLPDRFELPRECRVSPDGKWVTLPGADYPLRLVSIPDLEERILPVKNTVSVVAWSPDAEVLATGYSFPYAVDLWEMATGRHLRRIEGRQLSPCYDLAFSHDGSKLAFVENSGFVHIHRLRDEVTRFFRGAAARSRLAFSADGRTVFTGGEGGVLFAWDAAFPESSDLVATDAGLWNLEFSPDGTLLAASASDGVVRLFNAKTESFIKKLGHAHRSPRPQLGARDSRLRFSHDNQTLIVDNNDNTVAVYDILRGEHRFDLRHAGQVINDLSISPDGQWIATAGDLEVVFWDSKSGDRVFAEPTTRLRHTNRWDRVTGQSVQFSPDLESELIAFGRYLGMDLFKLPAPEDMLRGHLTRVGSARLRGARSLSFSPDGGLLACGLTDGVALFQIPSLDLVSTIRGSKNTVPNVTFAPDGATLAIPAWGGTLQLWNLMVQAEVGRLVDKGDWIVSAKFASDGRRLVVSTLERGVMVFEAPSMEEIEARQQQAVNAASALPAINAEWRSAVHQERIDSYADDPGAIKQWLVLEPIPLRGESEYLEALKKPFIPNEAAIQPRAGSAVVVDGKPHIWREVRTNDYYLNHRELAPGGGRHLLYAVSYVLCDRDLTDLIVRTGNVHALLYVNGEEVYRNSQGWIQPDWDEVNGLSLRAGLNTIVFKVLGGAGNSSVRFTDANANPVEGLQVTLDPDH